MKGFSQVARRRFPWVTVVLAALFSAASLTPAEALEYERIRVTAGEIWRLLTGQLIHWTPRMAAFDVGMLLGLGVWLELRGDRRLMATALALGGGLTALAVHTLSPDLMVYRGSSGVASALFVLAAVRIAQTSDPQLRRLAIMAVALFLAKAALESFAGWTLFAGPLPAGVQVVPLVHLLGGLGGLSWMTGESRHGPKPTEEEIEECSSSLPPRYAFSWGSRRRRYRAIRLRRPNCPNRSAKTSLRRKRSPACLRSTRGSPHWPSWRAR